MVEGADCGVLFFAEGSSGVVVCTFGNQAGAWDRPGWFYGESNTDQTVTTSWATYQSLSKQVVVPSGKTYVVLVVGTAEFECTSYTNWNLDTTRVWRGGTGSGTAVSLNQGMRTNAANDRGTVVSAVSYTHLTLPTNREV